MIIGITGTIGAGKGAVVAYLVRERGFVHYSARTLFTEKMEAAGIPIDRDSMAAFANALRSEHGPRYVFDELFKRAQSSDKPTVIESIRAVGEAEALKEQGGILLSVDADQRIRYERIHGRASALDNVTFEEFAQQEAREMHSNDVFSQNIAAVMRMADFTIMNNDSRSDLHTHIDKILETLGH